MVISKKQIKTIKENLPLLPAERKNYLIENYNLPGNIAEILTETREFADYFDQTLKLCSNPKLVANWLTTEVRSILNEKVITINDFTITPAHIAELLNLIDSNKITGKNAKEIFSAMLNTKKSAMEIATEQGLFLIEDESLLLKAVEQTLSENPDVVAKYNQGKITVIGFLTGIVLKKTQGKFQPKKVTEILIQHLSKH